MPGSLAELYGALLKQEPQGVLGAARFNPLMMAKALRQQQANPRPSLSSLMNYPQTWQQFGDNIQANYPTDSPAAVRQAAFEAAKNAGPLMTVYHGSPHKFDAFDSSKIGTGEGAQAYGHGLYFAENPKVAGEYAGANAGRAAASEGAIDALPKPIQVEVYKVMQMRDGPIKDAHVADIASRSPDAAALIKSKGANLYKVDLPDDQIAKMLDWDKPLSQQPEAVKQLAAQFNGGKLPRESMSGDELLRWMQQTMRYTGQSGRPEDLLHAAGVPGIRYLDQGSRGAGSGTSNFVVFPGNEGVLKILARE